MRSLYFYDGREPWPFRLRRQLGNATVLVTMFSSHALVAGRWNVPRRYRYVAHDMMRDGIVYAVWPLHWPIRACLWLRRAYFDVLGCLYREGLLVPRDGATWPYYLNDLTWALVPADPRDRTVDAMRAAAWAREVMQSKSARPIRPVPLDQIGAVFGRGST